MRYVLLLGLIWFVTQSATSGDPDINSLVQAEKDFSKLSVEKGVRDSFISNFAESAIIFRPGPVAGKKWYEGRPPSQGELSWQPSLSEIAASGELGYNTGPWEYREKPGMKPVGYGQFFSFWKKQPDGKWKVVFDHGYDHSMPENSVKLEAILPQSKAISADKDELPMLMERDHQFSQFSKQQGIEKAYAQFLSQKTRVMRPEHLPESSRDKALILIAQEKGTLTWEPSGGDVSGSADLAYTYGLSERSINGNVEKGSYIRAWRNENGEWKVAVDLMTPFPPEK